MFVEKGLLRVLIIKTLLVFLKEVSQLVAPLVKSFNVAIRVWPELTDDLGSLLCKSVLSQIILE